MFMLKWDSISAWGRGGPRATARPALACDWILETAIAHEQIDVQFQPLIEPRTGRVVGAEALARSTITDTADELFARAVAAGLDERLSRLVQKKALRSAAVWEGPLRGLKISMNLLPQEISRVGFDQWLLDEIGAVGIDPGRVTVEITESALLIGREAVAERLARLRAADVSIAVDDFGTGYSSLAYLTTLPLDMIKIDRGLIADLVGGSRDRIVVKAKEQQLIDRRTDARLGGFDQPQTQIARRKIDAVIVARNFSCRRQEHDSRSVSELARLGIVVVMKANRSS